MHVKKRKQKLTNSFIRVLDCDMLKNVTPIRSSEMSLDSRPRHYVHPVFRVVEGLEHGDQSGPRIAFFVNARAIVVELDDTVPIVLRHLVHHSLEPLERALLASDPIEVGSLGCERLSLVAPHPVAAVV